MYEFEVVAPDEREIALRVSVIESVIAQGACGHGVLDTGRDMEQACFGCESGDSSSPRELALREAWQNAFVNLAEEAVSLVRVLATEGAYPAPIVLSALRRVLEGYEGAIAEARVTREEALSAF